MRTYAVALAFLLAACGGDPEPRVTTTPSPRPSTQPPANVTPVAQTIRDAVAATLDACPCKVEVHVLVQRKGTPYPAAYAGVYDARTRSASLRPAETNDPVEVRTVDGRTFLMPGPGARWQELDFTPAPAPELSELTPLALVDPAIAFALAGSATTVTAGKTSGDVTTHEATLGLTEAAATAGAAGERLGRLLPNADAVADVAVDAQGRLSRFELRSADDGVSLFLYVYGVGVPGGPVGAPADAERRTPVPLVTS